MPQNAVVSLGFYLLYLLIVHTFLTKTMSINIVLIFGENECNQWLPTMLSASQPIWGLFAEKQTSKSLFFVVDKGSLHFSICFFNLLNYMPEIIAFQIHQWCGVMSLTTCYSNNTLLMLVENVFTTIRSTNKKGGNCPIEQLAWHNVVWDLGHWLKSCILGRTWY